MTDKATLIALAERVEGLDGPDRETNARIDIALGMFPERAYQQRIGLRSKGSPVPSRLEWMVADRFDRPLTSSLEAALTLVPEGHVWLVANVGLNDEGKGPLSGKCSAISAPPADTERTEPCEAATPALALCAAALRARAAQAIEARRAETTGSACESAVGGTDASDAALLQDIFDKMAEVVAPLPGIPDAPGQHAGTRAIEPSDGDEA